MKEDTEARSYVVMYDFPESAKSNLSTFYRRLGDLLTDQGGKAFCRSTKSAYIVRGDGAKELAYAIGALAERFGAGKVGDENGTIVLPLGDVPADHFAQVSAAERVVDAVCVDRRKRANKKAPRGIVAATSAAASKKNEDALAWTELSEFLQERVGAEVTA